MAEYTDLLTDIRRWAAQLGFARLGVANLDLTADEAHFRDWLEAGFHGQMDYMSRHGSKRTRPAELLPCTVSCLSVRMDYWPGGSADAATILADPDAAYVSRYALGRDYHKLMRRRLQQLCDRIAARVGAFGYRAFADSAPVLEKALARNAGLGWIGKHTNLIDARCGLPISFSVRSILDLAAAARMPPASAHCGSCSACLPACPYRRDRRAVPARRAPLHLLSDHRTARRRSRWRFLARRHGQSHLWLR